MRIEARSRVEVERGLPAGRWSDVPWEEVRDAAFRTRDGSLASPVHYARVRAGSLRSLAAAPAYARTSFPPGRDIIEATGELMNRIQADFAYDRRATKVSTPLAEAFDRRRGVCQDFAHVMIAGLRGLGLPAAYVSGYLRTRPTPGRRRLDGADATHAWVEASGAARRSAGSGSIPTNASSSRTSTSSSRRRATTTDVSPVDGIIRGGGKQVLKVAVDVVPLA